MSPVDPARVSDSEEAALKQGRGGLFFGLGALCLALLVGLWLFVSGDDEQRVYGELGRRVNGLRQSSFDPFFGCLLPQVNLADLKRADDLLTQLEKRARDGRAAYALHLRQECLPKLQDVEPELGTLILPEELREDVDRMRNATSLLRSATSALSSYLDDPERQYDEEAARDHLEGIARGWFDWKSGQASFNKRLKEKLEAR